MTETATFVCSICNEPSADICVYCTKDACRNHRCERCKRCSDCCECEVPLAPSEPERVVVELAAMEVNGFVHVEEPVLEPEPAVAASDHPEPALPQPAPPQASEEPDLNLPLIPLFEPGEEGDAETGHIPDPAKPD